MQSAHALNVIREDTMRGGLPAWTYDNDEVTELEMEHVFRRNWLVVCHVSEIPEPGDFRTFDIAGERCLTIRGRDGVVRSFHNLCRHRGSRVVDSDHGRCRHAITCPFHGWSYKLDGALRSIPRAETFGGIDRAEMGLKPVEQEIWMGFVFVRFKRGERPGPGVAEMAAPVADEVAAYRIDAMQPLGDPWRYAFDVNWKAMLDVDNEGYHVPVAHPSLNDLYGKTYADEAISDDLSRAYGVFNDDHALWSVRHYARILPDVPHLPESHRRAWVYIGLYPATVIGLYPDQISFYDFAPITTRRGVMRGRSFALPDDRREMRLARFLSRRIDDLTTDEDIQLIKWSWEGMRSSAFDDIVLSDLEQNVRAYHDRLRRALPVLALPDAPAPGTVAAANARLAAAG
jgi:phenylpropionate dioxygenase-like ring-hydroxylating dioxygenase large terminal subunit